MFTGPHTVVGPYHICPLVTSQQIRDGDLETGGLICRTVDCDSGIHNLQRERERKTVESVFSWVLVSLLLPVARHPQPPGRRRHQVQGIPEPLPLSLPCPWHCDTHDSGSPSQMAGLHSKKNTSKLNRGREKKGEGGGFCCLPSSSSSRPIVNVFFPI